MGIREDLVRGYQTYSSVSPGGTIIECESLEDWEKLSEYYKKLTKLKRKPMGKALYGKKKTKNFK